METAEEHRLAGFYAERVAAQDAETPGYAIRWDRLRQRLIEHGGLLVVPPLVPELHLEELVADLRVWPEPQVRMFAGEPNQCHGNTAVAWLAGDVDTIVTGYGLSDDGLWRQHTWGLADGGAVVVESTVARDVYAGVPLAGLAAWHFAASNTDMEEAVVCPQRLAELCDVLEQFPDGTEAAKGVTVA